MKTFDKGSEGWLSAILSVLAGVILLLISCLACTPAKAASSYVPKAALQYRGTVIRESRAVFGLDAPIPLLASQIHQESGWNPQAKSLYAAGLTQFTPDTAKWISSMFVDLGQPQVMNPTWAIRALVRYDNLLFKQNAIAASECDQWAFALAGYNGGQGWNIRDRKLASNKGLDPRRYWDSVETVNAGRRADFWKENRGYPQRILKKGQPYYLDFSGLPQKGVCLK